MVCTLIGYKMEPQVPGGWFHCQVEKVSAEFALFSIEKACITSDLTFIVCTLIDNSYEPIRMQEF